MEATLVMVFIAVAVLALCVAAAASFAASKAHRENADLCREMAITWTAIEHAQKAIRRGDPEHAGALLARAGRTILAYRQQRGR